MVLLAGDAGIAATLQGDTAVVHLDANLLARQAGQLRRHDEGVGGFTEVHGWRPALRARRQPLEAVLDGQQVAQRVPASKSHVSDSSTSWGGPAPALPAFLMAVLPSSGSTPESTAHMADTLLATRLKRGMIIKLDNELFRIHDLMHVTPGNLRGFVRVKARNLRTQSMTEQKLRSEDVIERATLDEKEMQYLYSDGDGFHFMDTESYEQTHMSAETLGDFVGFLKPEMLIRVEFYGAEPVGIELPQAVDLKVVETVPGIKGATATNQLKPATLETGMVVQVPPFIGEGDVIRVNTETGEYLARA
jgi:elongation factor P